MTRLWLLAAALTWGACDTLTSLKGGVDGIKGAADDAKGQTDDAKGKVKDAKGEKKAGDKAAAGGGGDDDDGDRLHAKDCPINQPIDDKVTFKGDDKADWRKVTLLGKPGIAPL